jgi:Family of unknown function (DUF5694)
MNKATQSTISHSILLALGNQKKQPGADLNAAWYHRNAKIFAKLTQIARPGDRVLVVFGSGHAFWLRHFAVPSHFSVFQCFAFGNVKCLDATAKTPPELFVFALQFERGAVASWSCCRRNAFDLRRSWLARRL